MDNGLNKIKEGILKNAEERAESLIEGAEKYAAEVSARAEEECQAIIDAAENQATNIKSTSRQRTESLAAANKRRADLDSRQKVINAVIEEALKKLCRKSAFDKRDLYARLIKSTDIKQGEIVLSPDDEEVMQLLLKDLGKNFSNGGFDKSITGGVVVRDGKISRNLTYDLAIRINRRRLDKAASDLLFPGESNGKGK